MMPDRRSGRGGRGRRDRSTSEWRRGGEGRRDDEDEVDVGEGVTRYYRITFRGVVSLLSDIDYARDRRVRRRLPPPPPRPRRERATATRTTTQMMANMAGWSPDGEGNGGIYVGHGKVVATRTPEIAICFRGAIHRPTTKAATEGRRSQISFKWTPSSRGDTPPPPSRPLIRSIDEGGGANTTAGPPPPPRLRGTTTETATTAP